MTKIENATNEQLDVLVATYVMGWAQDDGWWIGPQGECFYTVQPLNESDANLWTPTTNIVQAFEVDRLEWRWDSFEWKTHLTLYVRKPNGKVCLADMAVPLDPDNKAPAYCRGRVLCALKACGVEEI